jgi:hypothetical protein
VPAAGASDSQWEGSAETLPLQSRGLASRNFQLRVSVITPAPLNPDDQERVKAALARAVGLKPENGDSLLFDLPVAPAARPAAPIAPAAAPGLAPGYRKQAAEPMGSTAWLLALAALAGLLVLAYAVRPRAPALSPEQRDLLVLRIRRQLSLTDGSGDARS